MKTITAVPESIPRAQYLDLVRSLGFDPADIRKLEFRIDGIYAAVYERNDRGQLVIDKTTEDIVLNQVWIPVSGS